MLMKSDIFASFLFNFLDLIIIIDVEKINEIYKKEVLIRTIIVDF